MKKILSFLSDHALFLVTLFLLVFIPLYPKLPILDIKHTWVYIRIEDFLMAVFWILFFVQMIRKKATLKTPLSYPILAFLGVGALATLHGVLFLFPTLTGVFPQLAVLYWLRHVEYLSVFFIAFSAMRKKNLCNAFYLYIGRYASFGFSLRVGATVLWFSRISDNE